MLIYICFFTDNGRVVADKLNNELKDDVVIIKENSEDTRSFVSKAWEKRAAIIFIGATGIAVRMIAPFVKDKLSDSPVIVIDELGKFVIPILSGHMGGANELGCRLATILAAVPAVTTATDINGIFAIDVFARENDLRIINRDGIAKVSAALLRGENATMYIASANIKESVLTEDSSDGIACRSIKLNSYFGEEIAATIPDSLVLVDSADEADIILKPKRLVIGIGCKKGTDAAKLEAFVDKCLSNYTEQYAEENVDIVAGTDRDTQRDSVLTDAWQDVIGIASIDIKSKELALVELASKKGVPFITFTADELNKVPGEFSESKFVRDTTGTGNICERSAMALAISRGAKNAELILHKTALDGMTIAIARII